MAKKAQKIANVRVRSTDFGSFLDMLRYDGCTVIGWNSEPVERTDPRWPTFDVLVKSAPDRTSGYEFTPDRWASFGLHLRDVRMAPSY